MPHCPKCFSVYPPQTRTFCTYPCSHHQSQNIRVDMGLRSAPSETVRTSFCVKDPVRVTYPFSPKHLWSPPIWSIPPPVLDLHTLTLVKGTAQLCRPFHYLGLSGLAYLARPGWDVACNLVFAPCHTVCGLSLSLSDELLLPGSPTEMNQRLVFGQRSFETILRVLFVYFCQCGIRTPVLFRGSPATATGACDCYCLLIVCL